MGIKRCKQISIDRKIICAGDLKHKIKIQSRAIKTPVTGVDLTEEMTDEKTAWAGIKTGRGESIFDAQQVERDVTHYFFVRYISWITAEHWILYKTKRYDILDIENINEDNEFMRLRCNVRGATTSEKSKW